MGLPRGERLLSGASRPHLAVAWPPLRCGVLSSLLEPSVVDFAKDKRDFI